MTTAVLDVDLGALSANYLALCRAHPSGPVAGVVKANAYGLGAGPVCARLHAEGCRNFFVAHLGEALAIAPSLPHSMIAVLNGFPPGDDGEAVGIVPVLNDLGSLQARRIRAETLGRTLPSILHVDTGMSRLGLGVADVERLAADPALLAGIDILYVMTHLVSSEITGDPENAVQAARFAAACARLPSARRSFANASGIFLGPAFASDLARPGAALVGINPTPARANPMRRTVRLHAPVLQVREVATGTSVGYNATWRSTRPARIATVAIGYADGLHRTLSNVGQAFFDGLALPLVGRVSMDLTTFDATDCPALAVGDRVDLIGPDQDPDALAALAGTNAYEVLTSVSPRVRRNYLSA